MHIYHPFRKTSIPELETGISTGRDHTGVLTLVRTFGLRERRHPTHNCTRAKDMPAEEGRPPGGTSIRLQQVPPTTPAPKVKDVGMESGWQAKLGLDHFPSVMSFTRGQIRTLRSNHGAHAQCIVGADGVPGEVGCLPSCTLGALVMPVTEREGFQAGHQVPPQNEMV